MPRIFAFAALFVSTLAVAAPAQQHLLPQNFAGWTRTAATPTNANPSDAPILQEYGLKQSSAAVYSSGSERVTIHAWRFGDATGAYGMFTYFRQPQMQPEKIGRAGAAAGGHVVFWNGATVVDAEFSRPTHKQTSALTALAAALPTAYGAEAVPPSLPQYLPAGKLDASTIRYAIGPASYAAIGGAVPASEIDFSQDAEVLTARYGTAEAQGTLTLIMYPTPQIAESHLKAIQAGHGAGLLTKRSGPLVAILTGAYPPGNAKQLLDRVRFSDYVTINHPEGYVPETVKLYRLLLGITVLVAVLMFAALLLGLFLGGGRAFYRRLRGKPVSSMADDEFISLHLGS